jgi:hypothetical protein
MDSSQPIYFLAQTAIEIALIAGVAWWIARAIRTGSFTLKVNRTWLPSALPNPTYSRSSDPLGFWVILILIGSFPTALSAIVIWTLVR